MSRRNQLKVPKNAFVKFMCDNKTLHIKTKELVSKSPLVVGAVVLAPWENKKLRATILGLSDDPTDLFERERELMATEKRRLAKPKLSKRDNLSKSSSPTTTTNEPKKIAVLRRNPQKRKLNITKKIEIFRRPIPRNSSVNPSTQHQEDGAFEEFDFTVLSDIGRKKAKTVIEDVLPDNESEFRWIMGKMVELQDYLQTIDRKVDTLIEENRARETYSKTAMETEVTLISHPAASPKPPIVKNQRRPLSPNIVIRPAPSMEIIDDPTTPPTPEIASSPISLDITMAAVGPDPNPFPIHKPMGKIPKPAHPSFQVSEEHVKPHMADLPDSDVSCLPTQLNTDHAFWMLRPHQLDNISVTPINMEVLYKSVEEPTIDKWTEDDILHIKRRSHNLGHFTKGLLYTGFTLGELHKRNATGRNPNGVKTGKSPIDQQKFQRMLVHAREHFPSENFKKIVVDSVNSSLRYLWSVKLKAPWLPHNDICQ